MARLSRPETKTPNPSKYFLEWKSNEQCFTYYDKEKAENISVELPVKFLFLEAYHTVKGWNDKSGSQIYANEVYSIGSEPMKVASFKGGLIAEGIYKEIKPIFEPNGGVYHRSIYCMNEKGELVNISLKGAAVAAFSEFMKDHRKEVEGNKWFAIESALKGKKGAVTFWTPVFAVSDTTTAAQEKQITKCANTLEDYVNEYKKSGRVIDVDIEDMEGGDGVNSDDLPF